MTMSAIIGDLTADDIPEPTDTGDGEPVETDAPVEGEAAAPEPAGATDEVAPITDEQLAKLDPALQAAIRKREELAREAKRQHDRNYLKIKAREDKFKRRATAFGEHERNFNNQVGLIQANLKVLQTGDGKAVLQALQQLTGRDPHPIVEEINLSLLGKRKPDDAVLELRKEIAELKKSQQTEREQQEQQRKSNEAARFVEHRKNELVTLASTDSYPLLSSYTADNQAEVKQALANLVINAHNSGSPISDNEACQILEAHLTKLSKVQAPQKPVVGTAANGSRSQGTPAARAPAQSLTSQHVSSASSQREMSQSEVFAELADDPDVNRVFGGFLNQ